MDLFCYLCFRFVVIILSSLFLASLCSPSYEFREPKAAKTPVSYIVHVLGVRQIILDVFTEVFIITITLPAVYCPTSQE